MPFWSSRSLFWRFSPNQMLVCSLRFYLLWEQSSLNKPFSHSHTQLQHFWISASKCLKCESQVTAPVFNFSFTLSSHLTALSVKDVPTLITDSHFWISKVITGWLLSSWYFDPFLKHHLSLTNFTLDITVFASHQCSYPWMRLSYPGKSMYLRHVFFKAFFTL